MAAITNRFRPTHPLRPRSNLSGPRAATRLAAVARAALIFVLVQRLGWWPVAAVLVVVVELWPLRPGGAVRPDARRQAVLDRVPNLAMSLSVVLIMAASLRLAMQVAVAVLYILWQWWWDRERAQGRRSLTQLLLVQMAMFEALFLAAAIWHEVLPSWIVLGLVWLGAYVSVYAVLSARGERAAGVMAAAWAVICVEVSWVLLLWLFVYTIGGGYVLVPQPALILTAMAYCFGSIYVAQREGSLSRGRLAEYLLIGLILIAIVIIGTSWHGNI